MIDAELQAKRRIALIKQINEWEKIHPNVKYIWNGKKYYIDIRKHLNTKKHNAN
jgi:hypothetical protein